MLRDPKISQITSSTLIISIDIVMGNRGIEFGKHLIFENRLYGFQTLLDWMEGQRKLNHKDEVIFGVELTGPF
ncbi:hypothetical protein P421_16565 [Heyndrickxia coagulans P38]|nr:hypothetical protein P421_16565 [Heyndrickxia coagulans P38]